MVTSSGGNGSRNEWSCDEWSYRAACRLGLGYAPPCRRLLRAARFFGGPSRARGAGRSWALITRALRRQPRVRITREPRSATWRGLQRRRVQVRLRGWELAGSVRSGRAEGPASALFFWYIARQRVLDPGFPAARAQDGICRAGTGARHGRRVARRGGSRHAPLRRRRRRGLRAGLLGTRAAPAVVPAAARLQPGCSRRPDAGDVPADAQRARLVRSRQ